jgi:biotin synthase
LYDTGLEREKLMEVDAVLKQAQEAKDKGATRFCMAPIPMYPIDLENCVW